MSDKDDHGSQITATFQPHRTDDLSDLAPPIGYRCRWRYAWRMDADDLFPGEVAWIPEDYVTDKFGWVPDRDLADRVLSGYTQTAREAQ